MTSETTTKHTQHVTVAETWPQSCLEGECSHRDEYGQLLEFTVTVPDVRTADAECANGCCTPGCSARWLKPCCGECCDG